MGELHISGTYTTFQILHYITQSFEVWTHCYSCATDVQSVVVEELPEAVFTSE